MKSLSYYLSFVLFIIFLKNGYCQEKKINLNLSGGILNQTNLSEINNTNQFGGFLGISAFKDLQKAKVNVEIQTIFLTRMVEKVNDVNTYKGINLKGQINYLIQTFNLGDRFVYIGPGMAIHQPLNSSGDYNGPSFGANLKALVPIRISDFSFFLTYDFDYITIQGYMRNGIGINFQL